MKVKVFAERSTKDVATKLERQFNEWLTAEPAAKPVIVEKLTHPTFGWGQVIVSVWYEEG
ncbi:MAG TPA: hypothetical protein VIW46_03295 [Acidimicrobiia bacterium]|jgi:hypothetical protein